MRTRPCSKGSVCCTEQECIGVQKPSTGIFDAFAKEKLPGTNHLCAREPFSSQRAIAASAISCRPEAPLHAASRAEHAPPARSLLPAEARRDASSSDSGED